MQEVSHIKPDPCQPWRNSQPLVSCGNKNKTSYSKGHFFYFFFKGKVALKYLGWSSLAGKFTVLWLWAAVIAHQHSKNSRSKQERGGSKLPVYFPSLCGLFFYITLLLSLKTLFFKLFLSFYDCRYPYSFFLKATHIVIHTVTCLEGFLCVYLLYCLSLVLFGHMSL